MIIVISLILLFAFLMSFILTWMAHRYFLHKNILDFPNERSSHLTPTPRGGGIAIVITFILSLLAFYITGLIESNLAFALIGGGIGIASVGYWDDVSSVNARIRIIAHSLAAFWVIYWIGELTILNFGIINISLQSFSILFTIVSIVWCINFYNFMDGLDGLAGTEGVFVSLIAGTALWLTGAYSLSLVMWLLVAAIAGFTVWNWPPAKIFLGNVGSEFLGFTFATLGLYTVKKGILSITFWWLILAVFFCDATFTLLYRIYKGKPWYCAHKEHAYQHLISHGATHKKITLSIASINIFILLPMALLSLYYPLTSLWFLLTTIVSLFLTWVWVKKKAIDTIQ